MPRTARLDIPGLLQHVTSRGVEKRDIFLDDDDRRSFLSRLSFLLQETETDCLAWALLSNHFHLLLRPRGTTLANLMRRLLTGYAVTFNLRHSRSGHLFQNRYKSLVCEEEPYLLELVRYIHLNPLRAGIVASMDELESYPWSGHGVLMGASSLAGQKEEEILARFGNRRRTARKRYREFVADGLDEKGHRRQGVVGLRKSLKNLTVTGKDFSDDDRVLGSLDFVNKLCRQEDLCEKLPETFSMTELLERVAAIFNVPADHLKHKTRVTQVTDARGVFCYIAVRESGVKGADVARLLNLTRSGVSLAVRRGEKILFEQPEIKENLNVN